MHMCVCMCVRANPVCVYIYVCVCVCVWSAVEEESAALGALDASVSGAK